MKNVYQFLTHYNKLDQLFANFLNQENYKSFRDKVRDLYTKNVVFKQYEDDLFQLGNFRNAISKKTNACNPVDELSNYLRFDRDCITRENLNI